MFFEDFDIFLNLRYPGWFQILYRSWFFYVGGRVWMNGLLIHQRAASMNWLAA